MCLTGTKVDKPIQLPSIVKRVFLTDNILMIHCTSMMENSDEIGNTIKSIDETLGNSSVDDSEPMDWSESRPLSDQGSKVEESRPLSDQGSKVEESRPLSDQGSKVETITNFEQESQLTLKLREYQKELTALAEQGKNVIISSPPGSGKTIVACHIIKSYLERNSRQKVCVLMFTPGGSLAEQQCTTLKKYLPKKYIVKLMSGSAGRSTFFENDTSAVIVLTPQILLNELKKDEESRVISGLNDFGLLVFDECHRCTKDHPYNGVMKQYFALKNGSGVKQQETLPQIVGLSATLGIGQATDLSAAVKVVKLLCANLDAMDGIVSVKENIPEMLQYTPAPAEAMVCLDAMQNDEFVSSICDLMQCARLTLDDITEKHQCPSFKSEDGSGNRQVLKQWCDKFKNVIAQQEVFVDSKKSKLARTCVDFVEICVDVLDFYLKCRSVDALDHLQNSLVKIKEAKYDKYSSEEQNLYENATRISVELQSLDEAEKFVNPNLEIMEKLINEKFGSDDLSKGMIMVEMRKYAHALKKWMDSTESLKNLNARVFTGIGNSSAAGTDEEALTHQQQQEIMKDFRDGKHKLLICTPDSAGEGIDVADCNFVIIYDIMTNEVTIKQIKGRARKAGGEVYQLCSAKVAQRECLNARKTKLMEKARLKVEQEISEELSQYQAELLRMQKEGSLVDRLKKAKPVVAKTEDEYILKCKRCPVKACSSLHIRLLESTQHICIDPSFEGKYQTKPLKKKAKCWDDFTPKNMVLCANCGEEWGIECDWKGVVPVALLKVKAFSLHRESPKKILTPKKWKDVPFSLREPSIEELEVLLDKKE